MSHHRPHTLNPSELIALVVRHRGTWITTAIVGAVLTGVVAFLMPRQWRAAQGFLIRSEAAGYAQQRLGKFTDLSEMKTAQETILELARSQSVVKAVLEEVGPPSKSLFGDGGWPSAQDIDDFRNDLSMSPPGGGEFGKTAVFYIGAKQKSRERAAVVVSTLARRLDERLREVRDQEAASMVAELEQAVKVAQEDQQAVVERLRRLEREVGADLSELRVLVNPLGGQSELSQRTLALQTELRRTQQDLRQSEELLDALNKAVGDAAQLLATPSSLLTAHPALKRLKDGLVDAQLSLARLQGTRSDAHPFVIAAKEARDQIAQQLHNELPLAVKAAEMDVQLATERENRLTSQLLALQQKSIELANRRSDYSKLVAEVDNQTRVVDAAIDQLNDAKARQAGAGSSSVLATIDGVEIGDRPLGPGRTTLAAAGGLAGLILGIGIVILRHGPDVSSAPTAPAVFIAPASPASTAQPEVATPVPQSPPTAPPQRPAAMPTRPLPARPAAAAAPAANPRPTVSPTPRPTAAPQVVPTVTTGAPLTSIPAAR